MKVNIDLDEYQQSAIIVPILVEQHNDLKSLQNSNMADEDDKKILKAFKRIIKYNTLPSEYEELNLE